MKGTQAMEEKETEVNLHTVYFLDRDGRLIGEPVWVLHGEAARPPAYTPPEHLEFLGWSRQVSRVTENTYCVAVTRERPRDVQPDCRVCVLELRGQKRAALFPLGNWNRGEVLTREDLACLHLRRVEMLRPFRFAVAGDTLLAITDAGVRAFDTALRPLEGMLELMPPVQRAAEAAPRHAHAASHALLAREA